MSWFNKILKIFRDREVEYETENDREVEYQHNQKNDQQGKDVDAKIAYQYPKGQFRFPLIPDTDQKRTQINREERKEKYIAKDYQPPQQVMRRSNDNRVRSQREKIQGISEQIKNERQFPEREPIQQQRNNNEVRSKISKKTSRPFRPTEIPSPIYGYSKRPYQQEVIEFELEDSQDSFKKQNEMAQFFHNETIVNQNINNFEEIEVEQLHTFQDEYVSELSNSNHEEFRLEHSYSNQEEAIQYQDREVELKVTPFQDQQEELEYEQCEDVQEIIEDQQYLTNENNNEQNLDIQEEILEEKPQQRTHLPFNVMMLKQDKHHLEQKKIAEFKHKEPIVPTTRQNVQNEIKVENSEVSSFKLGNEDYIFPGFDLLNPPVTRFAQENEDWIENQEYLLNEALKNFGVRASVVNITQGPSVTRFEVQPEPGVKVNKITNLSDDIKLSLAAKDIRIEAPIPGKHTIGIEVPNKKSRPVLISEIIKTEAFRTSPSPLTAVLGLDISGAPIVTDLKKMPHGLIAGATGSGKSVCINSILISLLYKASPHELKLLLIDPKMVELAPYNHIPHLVSPVITDVKAATAALKWAVDEMERRYELFAHAGVRDINRFNELAEEHKRYSEKLPFIVIIIDELADLMMMSPADVEESICRIAQKARACGIHLIIATQRPSVDVITGLIKANVPTRTAFSVSSQIDSRTIIDISGAEKLLGRGDMLFLENGSSKPVRLQGTFVSDAEIDLVVEHVRSQQEPEYLFHQEELLKKAQVVEEEDELFYEACEFVIDHGGASTSSLQRRFKIGYNRAARLIDMMESQGFISEPKGSKPRDVLITEAELEQIQETTSSTFI
ncbi:DNA translocase FtsK [Bacillus sp. CGMCC 1.16607]|uniref:DNA translocase FtsK n=1 Tax=Bacillus sp. CGMCC 1.16607 TaxID=3351842 RepID=UPI003636818F